MHLLNTETHRLVNFEGSNIPFYAILSHTWGNDEIGFADIGNKKRCVGDRYEKIRMTCSIAKRDGFDYVWIDTCCIDKTSSAELSEAINSMYRWYQEATICYAYLADVSSNIDGEDGAICPEFLESRWFTRGWTLQELIAPSIVIFLSKTWERIGTKSSMKTTISEITGIPGFILQEGDLARASIAQRMSWASKRKTTRVEDIAYCLMGVFGVNMPMLYGEGERAFIRLQEEIMKISDDHSIFAWESPDADVGLLATSPAAFSNSSGIIPVDSSSVLSGAITINNKGIHLKLRFMDTNKGLNEKFRLAILPCAVEDSPTKIVGIYLETISDAQKYFMKTINSKLEMINLIDPSKFIGTEENICVRQDRQVFKRPSKLARAAEKGNQKVVKLLLDEGVSPDRELLVSAAERDHEGVARLLLQEGADPDERALVSAAKNGNAALVKLLLENGAYPDAVAFAKAARAGHQAIMKLLLDKMTDSNYMKRAKQRWFGRVLSNGDTAAQERPWYSEEARDESSFFTAPLASGESSTSEPD